MQATFTCVSNLLNMAEQHIKAQVERKSSTTKGSLTARSRRKAWMTWQTLFIMVTTLSRRLCVECR
jgi:hypothetical protein